MYSSVYSSLSPKISGTITGWSTNGDKGEETTYCYQLNNGGQLIQETELTANPEEAAPADAAADATAATPAADAAADATAATPAADAPADATAATPAADAPADATAAPTDAQSTPS